MPDQPNDILRDAVARNLSVTLVAPGDDSGEGARSRLLAEDGRSLWVDATPQPQPLAQVDGPAPSRSPVAAACEPGRTVGVRFRVGGLGVEFDTPVARVDAAFRLRPDVVVRALQVEWPRAVRLTQRRTGYRVRPAASSELRVKVLRIENSNGVPIASPAALSALLDARADLFDLSVGGLSLVLRVKRQPGEDETAVMPILDGDLLRVELSAAGTKFGLAGRVRHPPRRMPDGSARIGIQFDPMDGTIEGRRAMVQLAKLVADLQRVEARRRAG